MAVGLFLYILNVSSFDITRSSYIGTISKMQGLVSETDTNDFHYTAVEDIVWKTDL